MKLSDAQIVALRALLDRASPEERVIFADALDQAQAEAQAQAHLADHIARFQAQRDAKPNPLRIEAPDLGGPPNPPKRAA